MKERLIRKAQSLAGSFCARLGSKSMILLYHNIADVETDPWGLAVSPERLEEHLSVLQAEFQPVTLSTLLQPGRAATRGKCTVAVTFDDGYASTLTHAQPLLEKYNIPATIFVVTGLLSSTREFWWDELDRLLLHPRSLPAAVELKVGGIETHWRLARDGNYGRDALRQWRYESCRDSDPAFVGSRQHLYCSLYRLLRPLTDSQRWEVLSQLAEQTSSPREVRSSHRLLGTEELIRLSQTGMIECGSHSETHADFSMLDNDRQLAELKNSKRALQEIVKTTVTSFAYPFGSYTSLTARLVRDAGFRRACSVMSGSAHRWSDLFQLPRITVSNWNGAVFASILHSKC